MPNNEYRSSAVRRHAHHVPRPRASYSCHRCRARRVKCNKIHPVCGRCLKDGARCMYDSKLSLQGSPTYSKSVRERASTAAELTEVVSNRGELSRGLSPKYLPESEDDPIPGLGYLSRQAGGRSRYVGRTFWAYIGEDNNDLEMLLQDQTRYKRPEHEHWPFQPVCTSYYRTLGHDDAASFAESKSSTAVNECPHWQNDHPRNKLKSRVTRSTRQYATALPKLLEDLPSREACDTLYRSFVISIHTILPLLHLQSFDQEYERFWAWIDKDERKGPPTGVLAENPSFLPLLFAVLFGGAVSCPNEILLSQFKHTSRAAISSRLSEAARRTQSLVAFPRIPTIYSLMSFLIVQNLLVREEEPLASCSYISVALRVAQAMGIHRDGTNFGLAPIETEIRRRIWWHIIHTDVMTSIPSGLPPSCLSDTIYDAKMICELKDDHISDQSTKSLTETTTPDVQSIYPTSVNPNILDVRLMVAVDRYSITSILRRILRRQFDTTPMTKDDFSCLKEEVDVLRSRISARIEQLVRICGQEKPIHYHVSTSHTFEEGYESAFVAWAQLLLQLMVHKTYCVLYQPLVRDSHHAIWAQVRQDCIFHCQKFTEKFLEMCTSEPFRPYHWLYPGLYQPLHAAIVLLSDLLRTPKSSEAELSIILIDRMFSLISPNDGVVSEDNGVLTERNLSEGGREAWALLRRLRRKAWENMGRDPDVLWTEDGLGTTDVRSPAALAPEAASATNTSEVLKASSAQTLGTPFNLTSDASGPLFDAPEYLDYFVESDISHFNWMEWDAAMTGSFDMPGF